MASSGHEGPVGFMDGWMDGRFTTNSVTVVPTAKGVL